MVASLRDLANGPIGLQKRADPPASRPRSDNAAPDPSRVPFDDSLQLRGQIGIQSNRSHRNAIEYGVEDFRSAVSSKWQLSRGHLIENPSKENKSPRASSSQERACSGDMYAIVSKL